MKLTIILVFLTSFTSYAENKVVYGDDGRLEPYAVEGMFNTLSHSTAAMIDSGHIKSTGVFKKRYFLEYSETLRDRGICDRERFSNQQTAARCSGFLVGEDLLLTAGHCVKSYADCYGNSWVFDYALDRSHSKIKELDKDNIYYCKDIVKKVLDSSGTKIDYALIRLDRKVKHRRPLKLRRNGKISDHAELVVVGSPDGLPTKITLGGRVIDNSNPNYFVTNLDTFMGNSGSAVFNKQNGLVEGILVRGERDYVEGNGQCFVVKQCPESGAGCRGEDVTRISHALKDIPTI